MSKLLVSVRDVREAVAARSGGAAVIDIKEPGHGSLGRAADETIAAVLDAVAGHCCVSAALGELSEGWRPYPGRGLAFAKCGLAGCAAPPEWQRQLALAGDDLRRRDPACRLVAAAYADWQRASAPRPEEVLAFAAEHGCEALLVDTWWKDGSTLLDWLSFAQLRRLTSCCCATGVAVALAGSLTEREIRWLQPLNPAWFAVRGAVCRGGRRAETVEETAVRRLADLLQHESCLPGTEVDGRNG